jgi:hypothetical protein
VRFGNLDDHDGVEVEYRDPDNKDQPATIYIPADRSAVNPREIELLGVRSREQGYWHAWRAWNRIQHQNMTLEFHALQEAALVGRNDRVLVADNTRPHTQDGDVISQSALSLELSQPVDLDGGTSYQIFLQLSDGTVESIAITAGVDDYHVTLAQAPRLTLALDPALYARTTYEIVAEGPSRSNAFLITEKEPDDNFTFTLRAVNYSFLYYANDQLALWLDFAQLYLDAGPFRRDATAVGDSAVVNDGERGLVHDGAAAGDRVDLPAFNAPASYTKAAWVRRDTLAAGGSILSSTSTHEQVTFGVISKPPPQSDSPTVDIYHAGVRVLRGGWLGGADEWHHVAVTYDADTEAMVHFFDGELNLELPDIAQRTTLGPLHAVGYNGGDGVPGRVDDVRLYTRALSPSEVRELYRATRV